MTEATRVDLTVNGRPVSVAVDGARILLHVLREDLELTGTKDCCGMGVWGACSVIVVGRLVSSCIVLAA
jgi:carbon-monoxide dehydrogenase small subunit